MRALGGFLLRHLVLLVVIAYAAAGVLLRDQLSALDLRSLDLRALAPAAGVARRDPAPAPDLAPPAARPPAPADEVEDAAAPEPRRGPAQPGESAGPSPAFQGRGPASAAGYSFRPLHKKGNLDPEPPPSPPRAAEAATGAEPAAGGADLSTMLLRARQAFWDGDARLAEERYRAADRAFPGEPDVLGELGNLYFQLGRMDDALDAYSAAARLLSSRGEGTAADALGRALAESDPDRAAELSRRLQEAPDPGVGSNRHPPSAGIR